MMSIFNTIMVDFTVQFNLIAYAVTAALGVLCLLGNIVAICRIRKHRFGAFSVIYYILCWIIFLASLAVSALAVIYRTQVLPLEQEPFGIPIITEYLALTFTTLMTEITVYAVTGLSLISLILIPFGWGKKHEYMLPVMPADGDGYITITDRSQIHCAPAVPELDESVEDEAESAPEPDVEEQPEVAESPVAIEGTEESAVETADAPQETVEEQEQEESAEIEEKIEESVTEDEPETEQEEEVAVEDTEVIEEQEQEESEEVWIAENQAPEQLPEDDGRHEVDFDEPVEDEPVDEIEIEEEIELPVEEAPEEEICEQEPVVEQPVENEPVYAPEVTEKEEKKEDAPVVAQPAPAPQPAIIVVNERGEILNNSSGAPIIIIKEQIAASAPAVVEQPQPEGDDGKSKRARVRSKASEMFKEYLSSKSEDEKSKLEGSIDHIVKNKK